MNLTPEPVENRSAVAKRLPRRRSLLALAAGLAGGLIARQLFDGVAPRDEHGLTDMSPAEPTWPMEEEPLPHEVHLSTARIEPPPVRPPIPPQPIPAIEADPLIDAPQPSPPPPTAAVATPVAAPLASPPTSTVVAGGPAAPAPAAPSESMNGQPLWLRNAQPFVDTKSVPAIAVVIDDLGLGAALTRRAIALDQAVTLALMTYAPNLNRWSAAARAARHEILVHVPMQPLNPKVDPGPNALTVSLSDDEIRDRLRWGLGRLDGYVGINNHMGSRFTQERGGMSVVMEEVKARGLLFLDSVTIGHTVGAAIAMAMHVPAAERNVFLDDVPTAAGVQRQLAVLEQVARKHGSAIGIGHPHPATLDAVAQWLPSVASRGVVVVPLTSVVRRQAMS
jgi:uncharacterized protein